MTKRYLGKKLNYIHKVFRLGFFRIAFFRLNHKWTVRIEFGQGWNNND